MAGFLSVSACSDVSKRSSNKHIALPDFASIADVSMKKKAFFDYVYHYVVTVNLEVLDRKVAIEWVLKKPVTDLKKQEIEFIDEMAVLYLKDHDSSDTFATAKQLLAYVQVIPPSLALAQAANESAWGTSRFATEANNFFGQWCFNAGCGLVPKHRSAGQVHEVRKFKSAEESVRSYVRNLNTHTNYRDFRTIRERLAKQEKFIGGLELARGLGGYSERGEEYIDELQSMIRVNNLLEYDKRFWGSLK